MKIEVFEIPEEGLNIEVEESPLIEGIRISRPFKAILRIDKKGREVFVKGLIFGEVELQCSRCLRMYKLPIRSIEDFVYHPIEEINKEELIELRTDEMEVDFYKEGIIDTEDIVRNQIILNIPMKPLCSEDCKGLCPICGTDLNEFNCECSKKEIDPRLAVLETFLRRIKSNG
jgi:uncharacterized protein